MELLLGAGCEGNLTDGVRAEEAICDSAPHADVLLMLPTP